MKFNKLQILLEEVVGLTAKRPIEIISEKIHDKITILIIKQGDIKMVPYIIIEKNKNKYGFFSKSVAKAIDKTGALNNILIDKNFKEISNDFKIQNLKEILEKLYNKISDKTKPLQKMETFSDEFKNQLYNIGYKFGKDKKTKQDSVDTEKQFFKEDEIKLNIYPESPISAKIIANGIIIGRLKPLEKDIKRFNKESSEAVARAEKTIDLDNLPMQMYYYFYLNSLKEVYNKLGFNSKDIDFTRFFEDSKNLINALLSSHKDTTKTPSASPKYIVKQLKNKNFLKNIIAKTQKLFDTVNKKNRIKIKTTIPEKPEKEMGYSSWEEARRDYLAAILTKLGI